MIHFETNTAAAVEALREQASIWRVPETLVTRTAEYFARMAPRLRDYLNKNAELTDEDKDTIIQDYARGLFGVYEVTATREQLARFTKLKTGGAFMLDRYGFYFALLCGYGILNDILHKYDATAGAQPDTLRDYLNGPRDTATGQAVIYLHNTGQFDAARFEGAATPDAVSGFIARCNFAASVEGYVKYYTLCKFCLNATADELAAIPAPQSLFANPAAVAEQIATRTAGELADVEASFAAVVDVPPAETTKAIEQARKQSNVLRFNNTINKILSRDVYGTINKDAKTERDILPIASFIAKYLSDNKLTAKGLTPGAIERTIEGVNMLHRLGPVKPVGGYYEYETTITEFARLCGYDGNEANGEQLQALGMALSLLGGLYIAVWKTDGLHAIKLLTVPDIGLTGEARGRIHIQVTTEAAAGRPQLLTFADWDRLRRESRGRAGRHFRHQIAYCNQKNENDLLDQIFGYTNDYNEAEQSGADAETLKGIKRNQQKNRQRDKKRLLGYFQRAVKAGVLASFDKYTNAQGAVIWEWKRAAPPKDETAADE